MKGDGDKDETRSDTDEDPVDQHPRRGGRVLFRDSPPDDQQDNTISQSHERSPNRKDHFRYP